MFISVIIYFIYNKRNVFFSIHTTKKIVFYTGNDVENIAKKKLNNTLFQIFNLGVLYCIYI